MNIYVYQTDNRPNLDFLKKTMFVNKYYSKLMNYKYIFQEMKVENNFHPALYKIIMVDKLLEKINNGILIFLDSDAWIYNPYMLNKIIFNLPENKNGIFSRDPYVKKNTYINSGSFIIRINDYTKNMYKLLVRQCYEKKSIDWNKINHSFTEKEKGGPFDQWYISNFIFENKNDFIIYKPDIINTPFGKILRHSWIKDFSTCKIHKYHRELAIDKLYDNAGFPNIVINGYEFFEKKKINRLCKCGRSCSSNKKFCCFMCFTNNGHGPLCNRI